MLALLAGLDLSWGLVTIDAASYQKTIFQVILDQQADYVLTFRGNQKHTFQAVGTWFAEHAFAVPAALKPMLDAFDELSWSAGWLCIPSPLSYTCSQNGRESAASWRWNRFVCANRISFRQDRTDEPDPC
jgi:hypothetical protein